MVKASAYTIEDIVELLEDANSSFLDYLRLKEEERKAKKIEEYEGKLKAAYDMTAKTTGKYPEDTEFRDYFKRFSALMKKREEGISVEKEREMLEDFLSKMRHLVHWRKLEISAGKDLPFGDYRSLRGERGRRGI
jgi:hypothetical protein